MSPMEIKCPRCGSTWRVSEEKAGKRGRCPQCWGIIKVPDKAVEPSAEAHHHGHVPASPARKMFLIGAGIVLVAGVIFAVVIRRSAETPPAGAELELTPEVLAQLRTLNAKLSQHEQISEQCDQLDELGREERCLQAREVLRKDKAYEPVTASEYALRAAVKEEETAYRAALEKKGDPAPQDWRLDEPLREDERTQLTQKSADLVGRSASIVEALSQLGMKASNRTDLMRRAVVDTAEARKLLEARMEQLRKTIADVRSGRTATSDQ